MTALEVFEQASTDSTLLRWYVMRVNETGYWRFEQLEADMLRDLGKFEEEWIPKVEARYLSSPDVGTYICSFQRMAEVWHVESTPVWDVEVPDKVVEYITEWIRVHDHSEVVTYVGHSEWFKDVSGVSGPNHKFVGATRVDDDGHERNDLLEHELCNPSF